jgi:histidinol-phosphate aminotransferase
LLALGCEVPESHANFVWLPLADRTTAFAEHCAQRRVLVRPFAGDGARITVATREDNEAFLAAARSFRG